MAEIINLPTQEEEKKDLGFFEPFLESISGDGDDIFKTIGAILNLEEEEFMILHPIILQNFQQSLNNPNDKLVLVQTLNASGNTAEEVVESFSDVLKVIDEIPDLSIPKKDFLKAIFGSITNAINETEGIAKRMVQIPVEVCHEDAKIPTYANVSDSGMDVYALEDYTINPGETKLIPTGLKFALPPGYEIQVRPKSGRALKTKLRVANTPGTVDAGYRDEVKVIIENVEAPIKDITYDFDENGKIQISSILHGSPYTIGKGEKFCQLVLMEVPKAALYQVETVSNIGDDRGGGFGSSGLK